MLLVYLSNLNMGGGGSPTSTVTAYPDPFAATAAARVDPFAATAADTADPFAATAELKGA